MSPRDLVATASLPVECVLHDAPPAPLPIGGRRLLVAADGLYLEALSRALHACVRLHAFPTPYGPLQARLAGAHGPLPRELWDALSDLALGSGAHEVAACVVSGEQGYELFLPEVTGSSPAHVAYDDAGLDESVLLIDAHSHGAMPAYFSPTDDASDAQRLGPHLSLVLGKCTSKDAIEAALRLVVPPYTLKLSPDTVFNLAA